MIKKIIKHSDKISDMTNEIETKRNDSIVEKLVLGGESGFHVFEVQTLTSDTTPCPITKVSKIIDYRCQLMKTKFAEERRCVTISVRPDFLTIGTKKIDDERFGWYFLVHIEVDPKERHKVSLQQLEIEIKFQLKEKSRCKKEIKKLEIDNMDVTDKISKIEKEISYLSKLYQKHIRKRYKIKELVDLSNHIDELERIIKENSIYDWLKNQNGDTLSEDVISPTKVEEDENSQAQENEENLKLTSDSISDKEDQYVEEGIIEDKKFEDIEEDYSREGVDGD